MSGNPDSKFFKKYRLLTALPVSMRADRLAAGTFSF